MEFDEMMKGLGESLGIADFKPNADGSYGISLDGTVITFVARQGAGLLDVVARLCDFPEDGKAGDVLCRTLLAAMAPEDNDEVYSFFLAEEDASVCLRRTLVLAAMDVKGLESVVEGFSETLTEWRRTVGDFLADFDAVADDLADVSVEAVVRGPTSGDFLQI